MKNHSYLLSRPGLPRAFLASFLTALAALIGPKPLDAIPNDGLTAYWSFNEDFTNSPPASGNASPTDPSNLDLQTVGAEIEPAGLFGAAARFDGVDDYLEIGGTALDERKVVDDTDTATEPFGGATISVWFKADAAPDGSTRYMIYESAPTFTLSLGLRENTSDTSNTLIQAFTRYTDSGVLGATSVEISVPDTDIVGQWIHVVLKLSANELSIHALNLFASGSYSGEISAINDFHIGTYRDADGRYFEGLIDELAVWDRVLTDEEIAGLGSRNVVVDTILDEDNGSLFNGAGSTGLSLREALKYAANNAEITFASFLDGATIHLSLGEMTLRASAEGLYINASGLPLGITLDAGGTSRILNIESNASATIHGLTFKNGYTTENGGAINHSGDAGNSTGLMLIACLFQDNTADDKGGAIFNSGNSPSLFSCSFQGNQAGFVGGAISNIEASPNLANCAFLGNSAVDFGGAIGNEGRSSPELLNCTFQGNRAQTGGAIDNFNFSSPKLTNCILWNNAAAGLTDTSGASVASDENSEPTFINSLVQNWSADVLDGSTTESNSNLEPTDPHFIAEVDPLAAPTYLGGDLRPAFDSPVIDAGAVESNATPLDLAGNPRNFLTVDLGAYENRGSLFVAKSGSDSSNTGSSWLDAYATVQKALAEAEAGQGIYVAAGTYYPDEGPHQNNDDRAETFALKSGVYILGGFPSSGEPASTMRFPRVHETILSGEIQDDADTSNNAYSVLIASATDRFTRLDGFTISDASANEASGAGSIGGGLLCAFGAPAFAHCTFQDNFARYSGGAAYLERSKPTFFECLFLNNSALDYGGAIDVVTSSPTFVSCDFNDNEGGALRNFESSPEISQCSFLRNSSFGAGGAVDNVSGSSPRITNTVFRSNSAGLGGAISNSDSNPTIINATFWGNDAIMDGGAIHNANSAPSLINCILWSNTLLSSNSGPGASITSDGSSSPIYSNNLIEHYSSIDLGSSYGDSNLDGTDPLNDPLFVSEVKPSTALGQPFSLRLFAGSPAIDKGFNDANLRALDLDNRARIVNEQIDLGAYEADMNTVLWLTDSDGDGRLYGLEQALGTDPFAADPFAAGNLTAPVVDTDGRASITFGINPEAADGTNWRVNRSLTLAPGSFTEVFFGVKFMYTNEEGFEAELQDGILSLTDNLVPEGGRAFYQLEVFYIPPNRDVYFNFNLSTH